MYYDESMQSNSGNPDKCFKNWINLRSIKYTLERENEEDYMFRIVGLFLSQTVTADFSNVIVYIIITIAFSSAIYN